MIAKLWFVVVLGLVVACTSSEHGAYKRLAEAANPILSELRATTQRLRSLAPDDHRAVVASCRDADEALERLQRLHLEAQDVNPRGAHTPASRWVDRLLDPWTRAAMCRDTSSAQCASWCLEVWELLVASIDELRDRARKHDVEIVSLRP